MAKAIHNRFQTYEFESVKEESAARILTEGNIQNIRNLCVDAINEKLGLEIDLANPTRSLQREASLAGQIQAFELLIGLHEATIRDLNTGSGSLDL